MFSGWLSITYRFSKIYCMARFCGASESASFLPKRETRGEREACGGRDRRERERQGERERDIDNSSCSSKVRETIIEAEKTDAL